MIVGFPAKVGSSLIMVTIENSLGGVFFFSFSSFLVIIIKDKINS